MNRVYQFADKACYDSGYLVKCGPMASNAVEAYPSFADFVITKQIEDRDGDVVMCRGCDLTAYKSNPVWLWNHDSSRPAIGSAEDPITKELHVSVARDVITARCYFDMEDPFAANIARLVHRGLVRMTSIGFRPTDGGVERRKGGRGHDVNEWELLECSITNIGTNQAALRQELAKGYPELVTKSLTEKAWKPKAFSFGAVAMAKKKQDEELITKAPPPPPKKKKPAPEEEQQQPPAQPAAEEEEPAVPGQPPAKPQQTDEGMEDETVAPQPQAQQQPAQPGQPGQQTDEGMDEMGMGGPPEDLRPGVTFFTMLKDAMTASLPVQEEPMRQAIKKIEALCGSICKELYPGVEFGFAAGTAEAELPEAEGEEGDEANPFAEVEDEEVEDADAETPEEDEEEEEEEADEIDDGPPKKKKPPFKSIDFDRVNEAMERLESQFVGLTGRRL